MIEGHVPIEASRGIRYGCLFSSFSIAVDLDSDIFEALTLSAWYKIGSAVVCHQSTDMSFLMS